MQPPKHPQLPRISPRYVGEQILKALNLEKGLGYTVRLLALRPGAAMQEFLFEDRSRMMKPIPMVLLMVAVTTFLSFQYLEINQDWESLTRLDPGLKELPEAAQRWLQTLFGLTQQYFNLLLISNIPFFSLGTFLIFQKSGLNYAEHLVINAYVYCMQTLIFLPAIFFISHWRGLTILFAGLMFAYTLFAYLRIFEQPLGRGLLRILAAFLISQTLQYAFLAILVLGLVSASKMG